MNAFQIGNARYRRDRQHEQRRRAVCTAATRREEETAETAKIAKKKVFSASLAFSAVFSYPSPD
jgi:hypothetical protein